MNDIAILFNKIVKNLGFEDEDEYFKLVSKAKKAVQREPDKDKAFRTWLELDGTRKGLLKLLNKKRELIKV